MPEEQLSDREITDKLAAAFEKGGVKDSAPAEEPEEQPEQEVSRETDETPDGTEGKQDDGNEGTQDEIPLEETEYEGKKYQVPKELKDALLRQADYTRKTQEVADKRRQIEEQAQAVELTAKFRETHFSKAVEAHTLQNQIQQFAKVDWAQLAESNPAQYLQLDRQQRQLQEAFNRVQAEMQYLGQEFQGKVEETRQKAQAKCIEELKKDLPDFGPELLKKLDETGGQFGFSGTELASVTDPRMIRVLHAAMKYQELQKAGTLSQKKVQEAKPVQVKAARSAQTSQANAQLSEAKAQMKKTGKTSDVENFLAARFAKAQR